ncbi:Hypothetical predicted protein [Paramuricea clavata]|uniref:Uncharacterized protein n=1 Tax=Paramuricea clavata TaxID=317549 RepID=A0A7D9HPU5_PARCT|nr:Hypothetical predicted protein [Paramuricea clavata]
MVQWRQLVAFSLGVQLRAPRTFINIQIHRFENSQLARQKSKMADEDEPITFNSRSKSPYDKFSNFYEAEIKLPEGVFRSIEHYFQAMKFIDKNHSRFEMNGDLGKRKFDSGSWKESVSRGRFIKSAGGKSGTQKYKLTLRSDGLDRERAKQKMKEGLRKKFASKPFRKLLLETGTRMLVHTPMRGKTDYWTGRVDKTSGNINGENNMGKLLMEVRQELKKTEKRSQKKGKSIGAIKDKGKSKFVDENKDDDDIKDENKGVDDIKDEGKGVDDIKDDNQKGGDVIKGDDEITTSKTKDSPGYKAAKRKHGGNDVQVKNPDEEVSKGPKIKRKKIEEKSKDVLEGRDENKDGDKNKDDDKKGGVEDKGDDAETSRETMEGSGNKGEKRKREDDDVQEERLDEEVPEDPNIKRKKIEEKSKDDLENKSGDENESDGEETTHETKE